MDAARFDTLTRTLTAPLSRRVTLGGLAAGALVALGLALDETTLLAKKKKKKKTCSAGNPIRCGRFCCRPDETCRAGRCRDHCEDGITNFGETDKDCGGTCRNVRKCGLVKSCAEDADCFNNVCNGTLCTECRIDSDCDGLGNPLRFRCFDDFCFECAFNFDCPRPGQGAKQTVCINKRCVECASDANCPASRPFCVTSLNEECVDNAVRPCECRECRDEVDCASGQVCDDGRCVECANDLDCPQGEICDNGHCEPECGPDASRCGGGCCPDEGHACCDDVCLDVTSDPLHCGSCDRVCGGDTTSCCDGGCVNTSTDRFNCGSCGTVCRHDPFCPFCCNGACTGFPDPVCPPFVCCLCP